MAQVLSLCRTEEALRLLLDRREAELREAMKLRHGLTTLLHMLRNNMEQVIKKKLHVHWEDFLCQKATFQFCLLLSMNCDTHTLSSILFRMESMQIGCIK